MSTYEALDLIADSYNPLLFIGYLMFSFVYWRQGDRLASLRGFAGIVIAYLLMLIDSSMSLWMVVGLDYSTHSAVAIALIIFHIHKRRPAAAPTIVLVISLLLYYALEVYQQYHSVLDILSTALIVGPLIIAAYWALMAQPKSSPPVVE